MICDEFSKFRNLEARCLRHHQTTYCLMFPASDIWPGTGPLWKVKKCFRSWGSNSGSWTPQHPPPHWANWQVEMVDEASQNDQDDSISHRTDGRSHCVKADFKWMSKYQLFTWIADSLENRFAFWEQRVLISSSNPMVWKHHDAFWKPALWESVYTEAH